MSGHRPVILVIEHETDCPPAHLGRWLSEAGCHLEVRRPYLGDDLPTDLAAYDALLVLGGAMGATDDEDHPWLPTVRELVRQADSSRVPTLGVCLGHQLASVALGGVSGRNPRGHHVGLVPVIWAPSAEQDPLLGSVRFATQAAHWNLDLVTSLPEGAEVLATTPQGDVQAARLAPTVWGVQCHPEIDHEIFRSWADSAREECELLGVDADRLTADLRRAEPELRAAWRPLAASFAALAAGR
ncbi:type 1 glutamine amidotransferase [Nocardioides sp.]|uniref:type 1 glutamine amidotransferase n=1 Tax=Nocardioides sp. TaxID=35761 RepID=UPI003D0D7F78